MNRFGKLLRALSIGLLMVMSITGTAFAQSQSSMMMEGCMMMSGWGMAVYILFGILLFIVLILAILALLKYLFGKKT